MTFFAILAFVSSVLVLQCWKNICECENCCVLSTSFCGNETKYAFVQWHFTREHSTLIRRMQEKNHKLNATVLCQLCTHILFLFGYTIGISSSNGPQRKNMHTIILKWLNHVILFHVILKSKQIIFKFSTSSILV